MDALAQVRRERETETRIRKMDVNEIVALIHQQEDEIARLDDLREEMAKSLKLVTEQADQMSYERLPGDYEQFGPPSYLMDAYALVAKTEGRS